MVKPHTRDYQDAPEYFSSDAKPSVHLSFCLFADVLGMKNSICSCGSAAESNELLQRFSTALNETRGFLKDLNRYTQLSYSMFSDSIVLAEPLPKNPSWSNNGRSQLGSAILLAIACQAQLTFNGFPLRGALTIDELHVSRDTIFGKALVEAHALAEEKGGPPRIVLSNSAAQYLRQYTNHIPDPGHSSWGQELLRDEDGKVFLNYLILLNEEHSTAVRDLEKHRDMVCGGLTAHRGNRTVLEKYRWLRDYHNFFCMEFFQAMTCDQVENERHHGECDPKYFVPVNDPPRTISRI